MPLYGTLKTMPLTDLLQWLGTARHTGTLHVERNKVSKSILLDGGRLVGCSSDDPPERLGHFLLARGRITEDQLRQALAVQNETGKYLGMILVEMGAFDPDALSEHLQEKAEETIFSLFDWDEGVFRFQEELTEQNNLFPIRLDVQDVLLSGLKRYDEMKRVREVFHDGGILLRATGMKPPAEMMQDQMTRTTYEAVNGDRTLAEIVLHVHGTEFSVFSSLYEMYDQNLLEIVGVKRVEPYVRPLREPAPAARDSAPSPAAGALGEDDMQALDDLFSWEPSVEPESGAPVRTAEAAPETSPSKPERAPSPPPAAATSPTASTGVASGDTGVPAPILNTSKLEAVREELERIVEQTGEIEAIEDSEEFKLATRLEIARELMAAGEYDEALEALDELYQQYPGDDSLRRLTAEAEAAFVEKAYKHFLPPHKILVLARPMEELEPENISPSEFFLISRIDGTWDVRSIIQIAPIREADALRTLKRMRESGLIELRNPD